MIFEKEKTTKNVSAFPDFFSFNIFFFRSLVRSLAPEESWPFLHFSFFLFTMNTREKNATNAEPKELVKWQERERERGTNF